MGDIIGQVRSISSPAAFSASRASAYDLVRIAGTRGLAEQGYAARKHENTILLNTGDTPLG